MAEITRRRKGELLRSLFEILMRAPEGVRAMHALDQLAATTKLTEYEAGSYDDGNRRFEKLVRFATVQTVKAGWLLKTKSFWTVTEAGRAAFRQFPDGEAFYLEALRLYQQWKAARPEVADEDEAPADTVAAEVTQTFEVAEEQAWREVEQFLGKMPPYEFQDLVADLLRGMGYHVAWVAPPGKDGGIDILAFSDPLGTRPPRIKVQVKRHQDKVRVDGLRSFMAVLGDDDVGIFVNIGGFTKDAEDEARTQASRRITLVNLERLFDLWIEHYDALSDDARRRMPLKPIYFLAPAE